LNDPHDAGVLIEKFGEEVPLDVQRAGERSAANSGSILHAAIVEGGSCPQIRRRIGQDIGLERGRCERLAVIGVSGTPKRPKASCSLMSDESRAAMGAAEIFLADPDITAG